MAVAHHSLFTPSLFETSESKQDDGRWHVKTVIRDGRATVFPARYGFREYHGTDIKTRDTWVSMLRGKTWEMKVADAQVKWQRWCDRENQKLDREEYLDDRYRSSER